ncbi:MAG: glycosyltransferase family 39 protein [Acidobacteriota bacterium]|nr:glycosyltransferase family 39 protein [Acidobacteriota bacterium]
MSDRSSTSPLVRHRLLVLAAFGFLIYVPFLDLRDLWYPNEPHLGQVAQAMFATGDWILPIRNGEIFVDYPPLMYWAGALFSHLLGGVSEFALRLPNALAAIAVALVTCVYGSRWFGARTGLWAGFVLMTFYRFAYEAITYRPDMLFAATIAIGVLLYAEGAGGQPKWEWRIAGFAALGLAMLAKGPLGLLLPGLVLTLWHGRRREWRRIVELAPLSLISLAVYLPWLVACASAMGSESILHELYAQNLARFTAGERGHAQPFYYYLQTIWLNMAPWAPMLPFAIWWLFRAHRSRDRNVQLALWWFGVFLVFLSIATTKRTQYLVPAYPAAALLLAPWLASLARGRAEDARAPDPRPARFYAAALAIALPILGVLLFVIAGGAGRIMARAGSPGPVVETGLALRMPLATLGAVLLAGGIWIGLAWWRGDGRAGLTRLAIVQVPLLLALYGWVLPTLDPVKTYKPQSRWIREQIGDETHMGMVYPGKGRHKTGGFGFYTGALVVSLRTEAEVRAFFVEHPDSLVIVHEDLVEKIFAADETLWRSRVIREMWAGTDLYLVVQRP